MSTQQGLVDDFAKRIHEALQIINAYGGTAEPHHMRWVIDQVVRELCGNDAAYNTWVTTHMMGVDGANTYDWDVGIAP